MRKLLLIMLSVVFLGFSVPSVGSAEVSVPGDAYLVEDIQSQYFMQSTSGESYQARKERKEFMREYRKIVGKFYKFTYDSRNPKKKTGFYLVPFGTETVDPNKPAGSIFSCEVQTSAVKVKTYLEKEFVAKPGDVILVSGRLSNGGYADMANGILGILSLGNCITFFFNDVQNLSASGSGGFGMVMIGLAVIVIAAGGFYIYKKKKGEGVDVNVEDMKAKAEEAKEKASKAFDNIKNNVNVDDVKMKAEEAKHKAGEQLEKLKGFIKKDK